jgi:hypothetical protein
VYALPRAGLVAAGLLGLVMAGLLATNVVLIASQLDVVRDQRRVADRQEARLRPLLDATAPLVEDTRRTLPRARGTARRVDRLTRAATPLAEEVRRTALVPATRRAATLTADLVRALRAAEASGAIRDAGAAARTLLGRHRLQRTLSGALRLMRAVEREQLVPRAARAARVAPSLDRLLRLLVGSQQQSLGILQQSLAVQQSAERHAASLDRKIGLGPALRSRAGP